MQSISLTRAFEVWSSLAPLHKVAAAGAAVRDSPHISSPTSNRQLLTHCNQVTAAALVISRLGNPKTKRTPGMLGARRKSSRCRARTLHPFRDCSYRSWEKCAAERRGAALVALHPSRHTSLVARNRCIGKNLNTANILLRSRAWVRVPHPSYHRTRSHVFFQRHLLHCHPTRQTHMVSGVSGDKSKTPEMVAKFYNLVTDFYE